MFVIIHRKQSRTSGLWCILPGLTEGKSGSSSVVSVGFRTCIKPDTSWAKVNIDAAWTTFSTSESSTGVFIMRYYRVFEFYHLIQPLRLTFSSSICLTTGPQPLSKASSPQSTICCFLFLFTVSSRFLYLLATDFFFQILARPVFKMWVIQKPNKVAVWNKRHFEEKKIEIIQHV